jgi:membrane-associated phospholipid phosphatase
MYSGMKPKEQNPDKMKGLLLTIVLLLSVQGYCQTVSEMHDPVPDRHFFKSVAADIGDLSTFRLNLDQSDVAFVTAGLTITAAAFPADVAVLRFTGRNQNSIMHDVSRFGLDPWGNGLYTLPVLGMTWLAGRLSGDDNTAYIGLMGAKTCVLAMGVSRVPKFLFQRHRPDQSDPDAMRFSGPFSGFTGNYSFPSGHSFIVFATVASIAPSLHENKTLRIVLYTLASAVSLSRVYGNEHWFSDAAGGAIAGYAFGRLVWRLDNWYVKGRRVGG